MTEKDIKKIIDVCKCGNEAVRENLHLLVVTRLMYYCKVKPCYVYRLRVSDITCLEDGSGVGKYITPRWNKEHEFTIDKDTMNEIRRYVCAYDIRSEELLIQVRERNLRKLFAKITDFLDIDGSLVDVYYLGF